MKPKLLEMVPVTVRIFFLNVDEILIFFSSYGPKTLILTNFTNKVKKCMFSCPSFFIVHEKNSFIMAVPLRLLAPSSLMALGTFSTN